MADFGELNSTAWLGHDGSADTSRYFVGHMDNIQLSNFWLTMQDCHRRSKPAAAR